MIGIEFDPIIQEKWPEYKAIIVECEIENKPTSDILWEKMQQFSRSFKDLHEIVDINRRPGIAATRLAYKKFGKEPNRYRPSSEALCRRIVKGMELYRSLEAIDLINLLSVMTGYSIGGFDLDKVQGKAIRLGIGKENEPYLAIGRGELNIAGLPVWRDDIGGIGTPTSDNERTKLSQDTKNLLMTIHVFGEEIPDDEVIQMTEDLLKTHLNAKKIQFRTILCSR